MIRNASTLKLHIPQIVFFDTPNGIHRSNVGPYAKQFDPDLCPLLDDLVFIISPLPRGRIWVELDILRDELTVLV